LGRTPAARRITAARAGLKDVTTTTDSELTGLFHRLNNQLGVSLANAELLEKRLGDETQRARAGQVVTSVLEAIEIIQRIRRLADPTGAK
jgi:GAF domain-containing protein